MEGGAAAAMFFFFEILPIWFSVSPLFLLNFGSQFIEVIDEFL
jgi:hypothetical protein